MLRLNVICRKHQAMQKLLLGLFIMIGISGCQDSHEPDVSAIKINFKLQRFEKDFFAIDTLQIDAGLQKLHEKYPEFLQDFLFNVLALPAQPDSTDVVKREVISFIKSYKPVADSAQQVFKNFTPVTKEIEEGLKHVKLYFPQYKIPQKVITFIGPINSYGSILTTDALAIGLQLYMGENYPLYQSEAGQQLYPLYISKRFAPSYIAAGCFKNIISDMYPDNSAGRPLVEQMIEAGKRLYVLDRILPETADTIKTGYSTVQLDESYENEAFIWSFFLQNDLLFSNDPAITKDYMTDGPKTAVLGEASPGFIGQFVGWQIVKKWMAKNDKVSLADLMGMNPKKIFEEAKYKPK